MRAFCPECERTVEVYDGGEAYDCAVEMCPECGYRFDLEEACPVCGGTGEDIDKNSGKGGTCDYCRGYGWISEGANG